MKIVKKLCLFLVAGCFAAQLTAGELVVNSNAADPAPKEAFELLVERFEKAHPDVTVKLNTYDHEAYKTALRNWLVTEPPDVVLWFAGNRMKQFVDRDLFEDVTDMWTKNNLASAMPAVADSLTLNGKKWGVPYAYYNWGVYYRKDIFDRYGLSEPKTWEEFLNVCETLKKNGVTPITIGTKFLWTAAGWFDYLNMRVNGYDFHIELMDGKIPYTDDRVAEVFKYWAQLVEPGYFLKDHATYTWQEAQPFMYRGEAAMYLIGNFITPNFPEEVASKMDFFQFPRIKPGIGDGRRRANRDHSHTGQGQKQSRCKKILVVHHKAGHSIRNEQDSVEPTPS